MIHVLGKSRGQKGKNKMAFYEPRFKYHRYNFYQIKKTYENGDNVRVIIPRNPAEASIISNMLGGSSGESNSGVPKHVLNNPKLKGLYYSLTTTNVFTKFVFDFVKFAEFLETYGLLREVSLDDNIPTGSKNTTIRLMGYKYSWYTTMQINGNELCIDFDEGKYGVALSYNQLGVGAESLTYRTLFNLIGQIDVSLINDDGEPYSDIVTMIFTPRLDNNNSEGSVDLNEYPIDYMWFE